MDPLRRRIFIVLLVVFGVLLSRQLWHSAAEIIKVNDFEVFHNIGDVAAGPDRAEIYNAVSPVKKRGPFLYPPSAAMLLIPLSWLPHDMAGVLFTMVKLACLLLLLLGAVRCSGAPPPDPLGVMIVVTVTAIMLFRPVDSDIGNGQINLVVTAAAVGGAWLMMTNQRRWSRWWWAGAVALAAAVAVKMTPILLLAAPLLHRRWKALGTSCAALVLLTMVLPGVWFGWSTFTDLLAQHRQATTGFTLTWTAPNGQATPTELVQFTLAHRPNTTHVRWPDRPVDPDDGQIEAGWASNPLTEAGKAITGRLWLMFGLLGGAAFVLVRWRLFRRRPPDWSWDIAMLCVAIVGLSPRVQKAHLVVLIVPVAWTMCRALHLFVRDGIRPHARLLISLIVLGALLLISDDLPIPTFGVTTEPARPAMLLALLTLAGQIVRLGRADADPADRRAARAEAPPPR